MGRIYINEENMVCLRLAIDLAGGTMKPPLTYPQCDTKQRQQLADHIGIDLQTLDDIYNSVKTTRNDETLTKIVKKTGLDIHSWVVFLEKHKKKERASETTEPILSEEKANDPSPRIEHATKPIEHPPENELPEKKPEQKNTTPTVSIEPVSAETPGNEKAADANDNKAGQENEKRLSINQKIAIGIVVAYLFGAALVFQKVSNTEIDATVITSSATFLLKKQWVINEIEAGDRINAGKAFWTSDKLLNQTEAEMKAFTESGKPVLLRQLTIPAGVRVTIGRQTRGELRIKIAPQDTAVVIKGKVSNFSYLVADAHDTIPASAVGESSPFISFQAYLRHRDIFEIALIKPGSCDVSSAVISEIRFEEMENKIESKKRSAIYDGNIVLTETNEVINLHEYDSLNVTPSNRMLMTMVPEGDRIKVQLKGDVNQLSRASEQVEKDNESLMPRFISIIYAAFSIFGAGVLLSPLGLAAKLFFGNSKNEQAGKVSALVLLLLFSFPATAQLSNPEIYRKNAVIISSKTGSGFICAKKADSVFIITAYHVVKNLSPHFDVTLYDDSGFSGKVVFANAKHDLAVVGIKVPRFKWTPVKVAMDVELGEQVFFIKMIDKEKPLLPRRGIATIETRDPRNKHYYASLRDVTGGDSGGALLCAKGIAGIILSREVQSLYISAAKELITAWDKTKWQLIETP